MRGTIAKLTAESETARDDADAARAMFRAGEKVCAVMHVERDTARAEVAKLTADNAALRRFGGACIKELREMRRYDCPLCGEAIDPDHEDHTDDCPVPGLDKPGFGAGWVSPEEHAREKDYLCVDIANALTERDAARARLAEVEADRDGLAAQVRSHREWLAHWGPDGVASGAELARVTAEAEGLRARLDYIRAAALRCLETSGEDRDDAVRDLDLAFAAALASPTPAQGDEVKK